MAGKGLSHGWAWEGIAPPTGEPGPANQNECFSTKVLYYRQTPKFHHLSGWLVSDDPAGCVGWAGVDIPAVSMQISRSLKA
jgi:hypothetical protein